MDFPLEVRQKPDSRCSVSGLRWKLAWSRYEGQMHANTDTKVKIDAECIDMTVE